MGGGSRVAWRGLIDNLKPSFCAFRRTYRVWDSQTALPSKSSTLQHDQNSSVRPHPRLKAYFLLLAQSQREEQLSVTQVGEVRKLHSLH